MAQRRVWWSIWPAALAWGAVSLVMVVVTAFPLLAISLMTSTDVAGTDITASGGPGLGWRIAYVVLGVVFLLVPAAVVVVARKKWLGWLLVLLAISAVILGVGLWTIGIL